MSDYEYIVFDAQYFLVRNFSALKSRTKYDRVMTFDPGKGPTSEGYLITSYDFDSQDLVKQFFWSIVKLIRDSYSCDKVILAWDKAPYHKLKYLQDYKSGRTHICAEALDDIDPYENPIDYLQMEEDIKFEHIKAEAKYWIINHLCNFGMPSVIMEGYEADDLAIILSDVIKSTNSGRKSAVCAVDSDWKFWINEEVDFINFNNSKVWTYRDVEEEWEFMTDKLGIDLFELKVISDSTMYSHNGLVRTTNLKWRNFEQLYHEIKSEDYTNITDVDALKSNIKSFDYKSYPQYDEVVEMCKTSLSSGKLGTTKTYTDLRNGGFKVSYNYAMNYLTLLNKDYYESISDS